ncbi:hypothetical protein Poli38472_004919 [Pythium oligandrum]|uniref:Uncharacterized protein n=1 Tax=Pythium oligandrum TaxID=41045 RepID=A0A8K1FDW2_PYTOL|nr:hypothetical protein Poli38472_004919 [Pythium oligandrum]|eukprot:TMW59850.1 hypothetical protein Poli38472_004919 [Pythium oligandrum]
MEWLEDLDLTEDPSMFFETLDMFDDSLSDEFSQPEEDTKLEPEPFVMYPMIDPLEKGVATKIPKKNKGRTRRRDEISSLRREAQVLSRRLELLRHRQEEEANTGIRRVSGWMMMAAEQQLLRETKEMENAQLRELLRAHVSLSDDLKRLLVRTRARHASIAVL